MPPHAGYIIIKNKAGETERKTFRNFYGDVDKGSRRPAFMYPRKKVALQEEISRIKDALDEGYVTSERKSAVKIELKEKQDRLKAVLDSEAAAQELFDDHKDTWMKRRENIAEEISMRMPSKQDVKDKRVNPHRQLATEKAGGLENLKIEYAILSSLAGEDGSAALLQREA